MLKPEDKAIPGIPWTNLAGSGLIWREVVSDAIGASTPILQDMTGTASEPVRAGIVGPVVTDSAHRRTVSLHGFASGIAWREPAVVVSAIDRIDKSGATRPRDLGTSQ